MNPKKVFRGAAALLFLFLFYSPGASAASADANLYPWADINQDGDVDVTDVQCVLTANAGNDIPPSCTVPMDLNCDDEQDIVDTQLIINIAIGAGLNPALDENNNHVPDTCDQVQAIDDLVCTPSVFAAQLGPHAFQDVWGYDEENIYIVGEQGVYHFDGSSFSPMAIPEQYSAVEFRGVWVDPSSHNVYVVGSEGTILQFDTQQEVWSQMTVLPALPFLSFSDIHAQSEQYMVASGQAYTNDQWFNVVYVYEDGYWQMEYSETAWTGWFPGLPGNVQNAQAFLGDVWVTPHQDIFIAGGGNKSLQRISGQWGNPMDMPLMSMYGSIGVDMYAGSTLGRLSQFDGTAWQTTETGSDTLTFHKVFPRGNHVFAFGKEPGVAAVELYGVSGTALVPLHTLTNITQPNSGWLSSEGSMYYTATGFLSPSKLVRYMCS